MDFFSSLSFVNIFPLITIILIILFFVYYYKVVIPRTGTTEWVSHELNKTESESALPRYNMAKSDIIPLALILVVFTLLAVFNLGDTNIVDVLYEVDNRPQGATHNDSMFFDEVFFVRTAVEHIEGLPIFEWTHPPLGKNIIAASIMMFGMTPFGWRLIGALFGVLMLLVMYIFLKNMFGKTAIATCGTLLFGFEFMRFVQSRIGTVDTFLIFFILTAFFFMYRYITVENDAPFRKSLLPLAFSGLFFGLSFSIKWIGFYAGAGLCLIYIIRQVKLFVHYRQNNKKGFSEYLVKTLLLSVVFFVIIPSVIYYISYIPYGRAQNMTVAGGMLLDPWFLEIVWHNQVSMFTYHADLVAEHPFSSSWWQWLFNIRPILYVNDHVDGLRATFGSFGNPVIWWGGLIAIVIMCMRIFTKRDQRSLFIVIGYMCGLLPWVFVTRILFAYHYFPSSLFLIIALCHIFNSLLERSRNHSKKIVYGFTTLTGLVFVIFYPSLSGMFMPNWYYDNLVRWLPSWPF